MNSTDPNQTLKQLAADYVLGTLGAATRRDVEERMTHDTALRDEVTAWEERLLPLTSLAEPVEPDVALWPRIARSLESAAARIGVTQQPSDRADAKAGATPAVSASPRGARSSNSPHAMAEGWRIWWGSVNLWRGLAAGGYAAAAVMAAVLLQRAAPEAAPQYMVVLVAPQDKAPGWIVQASADDQSVSLIPLSRTDVPADRSLQFWTKADDWQGPVSLGLVAPGQTLRVPVDRLPPLQHNQLFELTLEPAQGSPLNRPTGPIQFIGRAVRVQS